ncbi:MAG TPA: TetR/AcrR family transcriptional regulator C-terminal domain-containing protein [Rectinemataceae bacterium]|nr:TetR/AcrR family transcriptional regulator C-terminal domain-containing protein [Rectinemataceae bacterium]
MSDSQITKRALAEAIKSLMAEKPMEKIGVGEIVARCGLNRKSFYYHFRDKYHLVNWIFYTELFSKTRGQVMEDPWEALSIMCDYLYDNAPFYRNALRVNGQNSFSDWFMEVMRPIIEEYFDTLFEENSDREFYAAYCAETIRASITRWLLEDPTIPPSRFVLLLKTAFQRIASKVASERIRTGHTA